MERSSTAAAAGGAFDPWLPATPSTTTRGDNARARAHGARCVRNEGGAGKEGCASPNRGNVAEPVLLPKDVVGYSTPVAKRRAFVIGGVDIIDRECCMFVRFVCLSQARSGREP